MLSFLKKHWYLPLGALLLLCFSPQLVDYATAWYHRRALRTEQATATAGHAQQQAATVARYTGYRLDSVQRATERQALIRQLRNLEKQDDSLSQNRPGRIHLPAWDELPRE